MKLIGLTGGIGSGKSTVAAMFVAKGIPVLDADQMAREVLTPQMVIDAFGEGYVIGGEIDRRKLGAFVFTHPEERAKLEAMTHPLIAQRLQEEVETLSTQKLVIYEAALIFEKHLQERFTATILVMAPESLRLERTLARGELTREECLTRMQAQMSDDEKQKLATYVIDNSGDLKHLQGQVESLFLQITST